MRRESPHWASSAWGSQLFCILQRNKVRIIVGHKTVVSRVWGPNFRVVASVRRHRSRLIRRCSGRSERRGQRSHSGHRGDGHDNADRPSKVGVGQAHWQSARREAGSSRAVASPRPTGPEWFASVDGPADTTSCRPHRIDLLHRWHASSLNGACQPRSSGIR